MLRRIRYVTVVLPTGAIGTREAPPLWHTSPAGLTSVVHDVPVIGILISVPLWQACPYRKLDPHVLVMQSAKDRAADYAANRLDPERDRRILVQGQVRRASL